jgi:hypothetical protein
MGAGLILHRKASQRCRASALFLATIAGASCIAQSALATTTTSWLLPSDGMWTGGSRWSSSPNFPNDSSYSPVINATGSAYTVTFDFPAGLQAGQDLTINSPDATLNLVRGLFFLSNGLTINAGTCRLSGGILSAASIDTAAGAQLVVAANSSTSVLDHIAITGDLGIEARSTLTSPTA